MKKATDLIPSKLTTFGMCNIIPGKSDLFESQCNYALECVFELLLIQYLTILVHKFAR